MTGDLIEAVSPSVVQPETKKVENPVPLTEATVQKRRNDTPKRFVNTAFVRWYLE